MIRNNRIGIAVDIFVNKFYYLERVIYINHIAGADPGFQVRGGAHLNKIAPSGGRRENFCGISCEKSRF
jgi:hypothetical protein